MKRQRGPCAAGVLGAFSNARVRQGMSRASRLVISRRSMVSVCRNVSRRAGGAMREDWLETERSIVDLHRRGMMTWIPPRDRDGNTLTPKLTFGVFADGYVRRHRRKDGAEIAGSTLRNLRNDIKHLKEAFGDVKLAELTEELVTEWYYGPHPNGEWQCRSECIRVEDAVAGGVCAGLQGRSSPVRRRTRSRCRFRPSRRPGRCGYSAGHARRTVPYI